MIRDHNKMTKKQIAYQRDLSQTYSQLAISWKKTILIIKAFHKPKLGEKFKQYVILDQRQHICSSFHIYKNWLLYSPLQPYINLNKNWSSFANTAPLQFQYNIFYTCAFYTVHTMPDSINLSYFFVFFLRCKSVPTFNTDGSKYI